MHYLVFDEWFGCGRKLKNGSDSRELDKILKVDEFFDSRTAGIAKHVRLLKPERDRYPRDVVELVAGIENPTASQTIVDSIVRGVLIAFGLRWRESNKVEMDRLNGGVPRRVRIDHNRTPDDASALVAAFGQRFAATADRNTSRAADFLRSVLRSLKANAKKASLVGGDAENVERAACIRDQHLAFWLRVAREWEEIAKTIPPPRYVVQAQEPAGAAPGPSRETVVIEPLQKQQHPG